ncbi:hypothetical protein ABH16_04580 [Bacillus altitudinis]|uniref:hypothetical protein n=1 Tax=Bacillus altitudinis TaxID=293387 RepID=UPI0009381984|nr:hypothetical protein [Bacillus altitudinis]APP15596.1 hypothetical protein BS467_07550 [Bacillus altitudinis]MBG9901806.1 hypothetical protein [Bacillus altitudinis]
MKPEITKDKLRKEVLNYLGENELSIKHLIGVRNMVMGINCKGDEVSSEDKLREFYEELTYSSIDASIVFDRKETVEHTLDLLGIKIEGVNA